MHILSAFLVLFVVGALGWCALALHYTAPGPPRVRNALAALALLTPLATWALVESFMPAMAIAGIVLVLVAAWFFSRRPLQTADWQLTVTELPRAELRGDRLTIYNVRNFDYRSETDYTPRWETRRYDLAKLDGLDMFFSHWGGPAVAHTILSWSFADGQRLAISIETRNRVGQGYSALAGFFRQFPIYYVVADERDVIRLRTNFRRESVWLYELHAPSDGPRSLLVDYIGSINRLAQRPAWYNALTDNCTTTIRRHVRHLNPEAYPWDWRLLVNGHLPELLYVQRRIDTSMPFDALREASNIDARANAAPREHFSEAIRRKSRNLTELAADPGPETGRLSVEAPLT